MKDCSNSYKLYTELRPTINKMIENKYHSTFDKEDLLQDAYLWVNEAIEKYRPDKGATIKTWIISYVKWNLVRAKYRKTLIKYPKSYYYYHGISKKFLNGENINDKRMVKVFEKNKNIAENYTKNITVVGDNSLAIYHSNKKYIDTYSSRLSEPETYALEALKESAIDCLLEDLSPINRRIFLLYFGLNGEHRNTVSDISKIIDMKSRNIQQRIYKNLKTIRRKIEKGKLPKYQKMKGILKDYEEI